MGGCFIPSSVFLKKKIFAPFLFLMCSCFVKKHDLELLTPAMEVALSPILPQELNAVTTDVSPMIINTTPTTEQDGKEDFDSEQQYEKPPPLHTVADWKIVLHLPEIETWLRMTSERVRDLTYSVQQDLDSKHVDVHLVQLKVRLNAALCWLSFCNAAWFGRD